MAALGCQYVATLSLSFELPMAVSKASLRYCLYTSKPHAVDSYN